MDLRPATPKSGTATAFFSLGTNKGKSIFWMCKYKIVPVYYNNISDF